MKVAYEDRLIYCGRDLMNELDKIIAEETYQERASILEYEAGFTREEAERRAREEMLERATKKA